MQGLDANERNQIIGENLRKYRLLKGLTQEELSDGFCSVSQLSKFENGKAYIKRSILRQMAERLGVTVERIETTDALQVELSEELQLARDASTAKNYVKAFEWVQKVIEKSQEFGYPSLLVDGLLLKARLHSLHKEYSVVISILEQTLMQRLPQDSSQRVQAHYGLGEAYQNTGKIALAYDHFCKADDEFAQVEDKSEVRMVLCYNLAKCQFWMFNNRIAMRYACKAEELAAELCKHVWRIRAICLKANITARLGQLDDAEEMFVSVLREAQDNSMLPEVGELHLSYAQMLQQRGDIPRAVANYQRSFQVYELLDATQEICNALLHLADLVLAEEELDKAESYAEQVLQILEAKGVHAFEEKARAFQLLGRIHGSRGKRDAQMAYMQEALEIFEQNQLLSQAYETAVEIAEAFDAQSDPRALAMYQKAVRYNKTTLEFLKRR